MNNKRAKSSSRRGAAAVEFAIVAPLFVVILLGVGQVGRLLQIQAELCNAAHEGGRAGSLDRSALPASNQTTNQIVINEVRTYLKSRGYNADALTIEITQANAHNQPFDLDHSANSLDLFQVRVELPYDQSGGLPFPGTDDITLTGKAVFRNAEVSP